jgi:hypothetical protein
MCLDPSRPGLSTRDRRRNRRDLRSRGQSLDDCVHANTTPSPCLMHQASAAFGGPVPARRLVVLPVRDANKSLSMGSMLTYYACYITHQGGLP